MRFIMVCLVLVDLIWISGCRVAVDLPSRPAEAEVALGMLCDKLRDAGNARVSVGISDWLAVEDGYLIPEAPQIAERLHSSDSHAFVVERTAVLQELSARNLRSDARRRRDGSGVTLMDVACRQY